MTLDQVKELVAGKELEFFLCSFVEMSGAPKAKLVPATHLEDMAEEGAGFAGFAAGNMGQGPHDPDMANIPDFDSLTVVPWSRNIAWVAGNIEVEGEPFPYCPRTILQNQIARAADLGYTLIYWGQVGDPDPGPSSFPQASATAQPGFLTRSELIEEYARRSRRDVGAIDFYRVLALYKGAVIAEGIYARFLQGKTLGPGFEGMTRHAGRLADAALAVADASPLRALRG